MTNKVRIYNGVTEISVFEGQKFFEEQAFRMLNFTPTTDINATRVIPWVSDNLDVSLIHFHSHESKAEKLKDFWNVKLSFLNKETVITKISCVQLSKLNLVAGIGLLPTGLPILQLYNLQTE